MEIIWHRNFKKQYKKLSHLQRKKLEEALDLFHADPFHEDLYNHPLKGKYKGQRSISVGFDFRVIFSQEKNYMVVLFLHMGTHNQVY